MLREFTTADAILVEEASGDPLIPLITTVPTTADAASVHAYLDRQRERAATGRGTPSPSPMM